MKAYVAFWALALLATTACRQPADRAAMAFVPGGDGSSAEATRPSSTADAGSTPLPASDVRLRRLWTSSYRTFRFSSVSPDGRYLSMVDWSTIDLAVRDLITGELYRLTDAERRPGIPYQDAGASVFSPDGQRILFAWQRVPDVQLRAIDFEADASGAPRATDPVIVFDNPEFEPYVPFDWSPDGQQILAKVWMGGEENHTHSVNHLVFVSTADGSLQALRSFDWREPLRAAFSPDGRYVAYDFPPEDDSPNRDIFVVAADGTREEVVVAGPAIDRLLDWHPDGSLLFQSDRGGSPGVWRLPMVDGRAVGPAMLVKADMWGVEPLGSGPGRFYYGVDVNPPRLYGATLDLAAGGLTGPPVPLVDPSQLDVEGWAWSPDGNHLAYSASRPGTSGSVIGIMSASGTDPQIVRLELEATSQIRWQTDGASLVLSTLDDKARPGFYQVDLESGEVTLLLRWSGVTDGRFDLSPDGGTLFYSVVDPDRTSDSWLTLVARDLASGEERRLGEIGWPGRIEVSPDGSAVAAVVHDPAQGENAGSLGTLPVGGGAPRPLHRRPEGTYSFAFAWTPDAASILLFTAKSTRDPADREVTLWSVDANGEVARRLRLAEHVNPANLAIHPDGRRIAFMAGKARGEVWVMEGLGAGDR